MADTRKTVLITGAGIGGIGGCLAEEFQRNGYRVFATARRPETIAPLKESGIELLSLDVTNAESIAACKAQVAELTGGTLDILVNNAGRNYTMPALDVTLPELRDLFETNVYGVMMVTQAFAPLIIEAKGKIVMIGSLAAIMPYTFGAGYNASKAALHAYTNTLRVEMKCFGVQVVNIVTGGVETLLARVDRSLPADSYYLPINDAYKKRLLYSQKNSVSPALYAKNVVAKVIRPYPNAWIYEGYYAWRAWALDTFFPKWIFDNFMQKSFGLYRLKQLWDAKKSA